MRTVASVGCFQQLIDEGKQINNLEIINNSDIPLRVDFRNVNNNLLRFYNCKFVGISFEGNHNELNSLFFEQCLFSDTKLKDLKNIRIEIFDTPENEDFHLGNLLISSVHDSEFKIVQHEINFLKIENSTLKNFVSINSKFHNLFLFGNAFKSLYFDNFTIQRNFEINHNNSFSSFTLLNYKNSKNSKFKILSSSFIDDFRLDSFKVNYLSIENNSFKGYFFIRDIDSSTINIMNNIFEKGCSFNNISFNNSEYSETYRTLKQISHKNQDQKNNLKYYVLEQNFLLREVDVVFFDKVILCTKKIISNHGTNFIQAVIVTLLITFLFYSLTYLIISEYTINNINKFFAGYFKYLIPINYNDPTSENTSFIKCSKAWPSFLFGKIILLLGIYETIISFRKFHT